FLLLGGQAGSLEFGALRALPPLSPVLAGLVFVAALIGFGTKAGFVPFHVWLPEAHPAAPSHVSALMSGVMIKMGLYGLLRVLTFLGQPALWWGPTLAGLGLLTGLVGIALAVQQRDVKRVLAYSSIENVGLIGLALGVGLWGRASGLPAVAVVRLTGIALLGSPRSEAARHAHESSPWLLGPMLLLVVLCLGVAVIPGTVTGWMVGPLDQVLGREAGLTLLELESSEAPLH